MTVRLADAVGVVKVRRADVDGWETDELRTVSSMRDEGPVGDDGEEGLPLRRRYLPEVALYGWPIGNRSTMDLIPGTAVRLWLWCRRHRHCSVGVAVGAASVEVSRGLNLEFRETAVLHHL